MSANYYYFISSLPHLRLGDEPLLTSEDYLDLCQYQLSAELVATLVSVSLSPRDQACCTTETAWNAFEIFLRNALVRARAGKLGKEAQPYLETETAAYGGLEAQVQEAMGRNPLLREEQLDRVRWQFLENEAVGHEFDFDALFRFRVKLLLLEKRVGLDPSAGKARVDESLDEKLAGISLTDGVAT